MKANQKIHFAQRAYERAVMRHARQYGYVGAATIPTTRPWLNACLRLRQKGKLRWSKRFHAYVIKKGRA